MLPMYGNVISRGNDISNPLGIPAQLSKLPPKEPPSWKCSVCTYKNKPRRPGCEMCTNPRPEDYEVPEDIPLDTLQLDEQENDKLFKEVRKHGKKSMSQLHIFCKYNVKSV